MNPKQIDRLTNLIFILSGVSILIILVIVVGFILMKGFSFMDLEFLLSKPIDSGKGGGIFPMLLSTIYMVSVAALIAIPVGVCSSIYISEFASNKNMINLIRFASQVLSAVPSIVFGLFGLAFLVFFLKIGWSILTGSIVLALMAIPTIFQVSEVSLQAVPDVYREGCYAMGANKWQCIASVLLPVAIPGIFTGIILAMTRAISEAAAIMYVVGSSLDIPISILDTGRPLPLHLYILASEGIAMDNAYGTAAVLVILVLSITLLSNCFVNNYQKKLMGC